MEGAQSIFPTPVIQCLPVGELRPHEAHDSAVARVLSEEIRRVGEWTHPVAIDAESWCVMDGHHRIVAAQLLGLRQIPCVLYRYGDVAVHARNPAVVVDVATILARCRTGQVYPPKSTRHIFPHSVRCRIPLEDLR